MNIIIKTQAELDALPDSFSEYTVIEIHSGAPGARISVTKARENSSVEARENSSVVARGNSSVEARENSSVVARGNSSVVARENSSVVAWENSSVVARENSSVVAWENSSVEAWENSSVVARGNSSVVARENSSVVAWENSSVVARENVGVHVQSDGTTLELFGFAVAWLIAKSAKVKIRSKTARVIKPVKKAGLEGWLDDEGVKVDTTHVTFFKRVSSDWKTQEGTTNETAWALGSTVEHPDWTPTSEECGSGKYHACSRPYFCVEFRNKPGDRFIAIKIAVKDLHVWPAATRQYQHKIAFRCGVVLHECDRMGRPMAAK